MLSWHPWWRSLDHVYKSLFLAVYSVPLIGMSVFMPVGFLSGSAGNESAFNAGDIGDVGSIHELEDPLEKEMATPSSVLAWGIPWTEESGGLQSKRSQRVSMTEWLSMHFMSKLHFLVTVPLSYVLKSEASSFAVLSKIVLPIWGPRRFCINCKMDFSISEKNSIGILIGIALNL